MKKREEERRIMAEFNAALEEERQKTAVEQTESEQLCCRRCKAKTEKGVCPVCGYKEYVEMSEEKRRKIRTAVWVIGVGIFLALLLILK